MRTTIEFPDDLLKLAKKRALERNTTLKAVIVDALKKDLARAGGERGRRLRHPLVQVSPNCPVLKMNAATLSRVDAESDKVRLHDLSG
jgi:hypothetical protein